MKFIRSALAVFFVFILLYYIGFDDLSRQFTSFNYFYFILFLLISYPLIWASCRKWKLFIPDNPEAPSTMPSTARLMRYYTISYFANLFLPSTLGGDAARSYKLGSFLGSQIDAFATTFLERLTGLLSMVLIALFVVLAGFSVVPEFNYLIIVISLSIIFLSWSFLSEKGNSLFFKFVNLIKLKFTSREVFQNLIEKIISLKRVFDKSRSVFFRALLWSFLFHFLTIVNTYLASLTIGWMEVSILQLCIVVPLVLLVSMIPLTPGGIGIQEGAFLYLLTKIGASPAEALSIALVLRFKTLFLGVIGGFFFLRKD